MPEDGRDDELQPTEWGKLLRLARNARGLSLPDAAKLTNRVVSTKAWGNIERGVEHSHLTSRRSRGKADTVAHMAHVVRVTPDELSSAGRPDAAAILVEILRKEAAVQAQAGRPADPALAHVAETPGVSDEVRRGLAALIEGARAREPGGDQRRQA